MKSKNVLSWLMCALWVSSCITAPVRPENAVFEEASGSRLTFATRGLYSNKDSDAVLDGFYQKLMDNRVVLKYEPDQPLLAVFARSGDDTVITINAYYQNFGPYDRDVMLTAILAAAAAYENPPAEEENVKALFFDTIEAYIESEYPLEDIVESSWYAEQTLLVGENSIHLPT